LGNICRSPTAEGVFRREIEAQGLSDRVHIDSAGTHNYHPGKAPDPRTRLAAQRRGIDLTALRARQITDEDFETFDWIVAMDESNMAHLQERCPPQHRHKLSLLLEHSPNQTVREVPDPYYGEEEGFEYVLDLLEAEVQHLLVKVKAALDAAPA
jgi:protein-tyrosine phosphatase